MARPGKCMDVARGDAGRGPKPASGTGRLLAGLLVAGLLFVLLLRQVDLHAVARALRSVRWSLLLLLPLLSYVSVYLKGVRWSVALGAGSAARPRRRLFSASMIGAATNAVLPVRLGDLLRAVVLKRHNEVAMPRALLASWAAQAFDMLAVALLLLAFVAADETVASRRALVLLLAAVISGMILAAALASRPRPLVAGARRLPFGLGERAAALVEHAAAGLRFLAVPAVLARVVGFTALVWIADLFAMTLALRAFRIEVSLAASGLLLASISLSFALPLTPGNLGTYQWVAVLVLGRLGVEPERALAFGLGTHGVGLIGLLIPGFILLQRERLVSWRALRVVAGRESSERESTED